MVDEQCAACGCLICQECGHCHYEKHFKAEDCSTDRRGIRQCHLDELETMINRLREIDALGLLDGTYEGEPIEVACRALESLLADLRESDC